MTKNIKIYGIAFLVFLVIDMVWLNVVAKQLYFEQLGYLMTTEVNVLAAVIFYVLFIVGLQYFVINPNLQNHAMKTLCAGAFFGLVTYATYDLTNLATIKDWPILITAVDLVWGSVLSASVATVTHVLVKKLKI